jgi:hypothetical protein
MPLPVAEIEQEVSQLTQDERERLVGFLIESLEPADEGDI